MPYKILKPVGKWERTYDNPEVMLPDHPMLEIYTDGSYMKNHRAVGYGFTVYVSGERVYYEYGRVVSHIESRQVTGELAATMRAVKWTLTYAPNVTLHLFYDYTGVEFWVTGVWQARKPVALQYAEYMTDRIEIESLDIHFYKVPSHSNNPYNDEADELAKRGALLYVNS